MQVEKVGFLVKDSDYSWECMRSLFGMLTENYWCSLFMVGARVQLPPEMDEEEFLEHLEMFTEDMEAEFYTTVEADARQYRHLTHASLEEMVPRMKECGLLIPF